MVLKAYNGRCVLSWLGQELLEALEVHHDNDLLMLVASCTKLCMTSCYWMAMLTLYTLKKKKFQPPTAFVGSQFRKQKGSITQWYYLQCKGHIQYLMFGFYSKPMVIFLCLSCLSFFHPHPEALKTPALLALLSQGIPSRSSSA